MKYTVVVKKQVVVNDDPHNRWYWGASNRTRIETLEHTVCTYNTHEDASEALANFSAINPERDYRIEIRS